MPNLYPCCLQKHSTSLYTILVQSTTTVLHNCMYSCVARPEEVKVRRHVIRLTTFWLCLPTFNWNLSTPFLPMMSLTWENIPGSLPLNRTATISAQKELFWAQCTHAQLNPFYYPFYLDVTHVREDTRTSPALPYWIKQKAGLGLGTRLCMSKTIY